MEKHYRTGVRSDSDHDELPEVVAFSIDETTAREIVRLAALVKANGIYKVEKFDYRARYYQRDIGEGPDVPEIQGEDNDVRTDADCLNVSETDFWFSAYLKHCDVDIRGERQRVCELIDFFGIVIETANPGAGHQAPPHAISPSIATERAELDAFVHEVAGLSIWGYDNDDGEPYQECRTPSDGFLDSHQCLMGLIEQARHLREGQ